MKKHTINYSDPIPINGDTQKLALLKLSIDAIGGMEHPHPGDPHLLVKFIDGTTLKTLVGYEDIIIGDFNDEEQETCLRHHEEITSVGFYTHSSKSGAELTFYPIENILSIQVTI